MNLEQIRIDFVAEQDRLVMRLASGDRSEILLWLTKLRETPVAAAGENGRVGAGHSAAAAARGAAGAARHGTRKRAVESEFLHAVRRGRPLGAEPIVVARINTGRNPEGKNVLVMLPQQGQGVTLALDDVLLHGLCKLLQDVVGKSEWDMVLTLPTGPVAAAAEGTPRVLN